MGNGLTEFIFAHHADKVVRGENMADEAPGYPMITKLGEWLTREKAKMLMGVIDKMPAGAVLILGGVSNAARTKSTLAVYTDELFKLPQQVKKSAVIFFKPPKNNDDMLAALTHFCGIGWREETKLVVEFPFQIAEFVSLPGQNEGEIAKGILAGLNREESFFRRFFPDKQITFFNVGHSVETHALICFLSRKNNGYKGNARFSFM